MRQLELNIRNIVDLEKAIETISKTNYSGVTITCKKANLDSFMVVGEIQKYFPDLEVIPTFSIATNYQGSADATYQKLLKLVAFAQTFGVHNVLLVSGNPRKKLDTINCLERFHEFRKWVLKSSDDENIQKLNQWKFSVAYNPYLKDIDKENQKLQKKLEKNSIESVYIQIGEDINKLQKGIDYIRSINKDIKIWVAVLTPSIKLLTRLNFRPWGGVFLSEEFLHDLEFAKQKTKEITDLCVEQNLGVLETVG
jgi:hypothetical protein